MKQIFLNNSFFSIPVSWEEITIRQQLNVEAFVKENPDFPSLAMIAGYCNIPIEELKTFHIKDIRQILEHLTFVKNQMPSNPVHEFEFKNEKYIVTDTLIRSQFQDFLTIEQLLDNHKNDQYKALPFIIAVVAKKQNEVLTDYDLTQRAKLFEELPLTIAHSIYLFFCLIARISSVDFHKVLQNQDQEINSLMNSIQDTLKKQNGGGLPIHFARKTLQIYLKYLRKSWKQYYSGYSLKTGKGN